MRTKGHKLEGVRDGSISRRRLFKYAGLASIGLIASYSVTIGRKMLQYNSYDIRLPRLPRAFNGFKIVHLTDIHYSFFLSLQEVRTMFAGIGELKPDLIAVTGDIIDGTGDDGKMQEVWSELTALNKRVPVVAIFGNHDHWACSDNLIDQLTDDSICLRHKSIVMERGGRAIRIAGDGDLWEDSSGLDKLLQDIPPDEPRIVLAHNPDAADKKVTERVDLMLSGHTHGGQIDIPLFGPPFLSVNNRKYCRGLVQGPQYPVFISRGVGSAILPVRFNCRPEVAVLNLLSS
jgi:uncharacterized protein